MLIAFAAAAAPADAGLETALRAYADGDYATAYRLLAPRAGEDPDVKNVVALMLYQGSGTVADPPAALRLFEEAARSGSDDAMRNLGILHAIGAPGVPVDYREAMSWFVRLADKRAAELPGEAAGTAIPETVESRIPLTFDANGPGQRVFETYCAGCHGLNGMKAFDAAPSFAMGERMTRSRGELMNSILYGKGIMPAWDDKLPDDELEAALDYLRELALRTGFGTEPDSIVHESHPYFIFLPGGLLESEGPDPDRRSGR